MELIQLPVTPFVENALIVRHGGEALIVDPGEATPEMFNELEDLEVRAIINTHGHADHCGGNADLKSALGSPLMIHEADLELLRHIEDQGRMFGVPFPASPDPDSFLEEGMIVEVGGAAFTVRHTPGHSPGHVVLIGDGIVIGGDVLFAGSIGRTDLPGGDHAQLLDSIQRVLLPLPDETVVYCGHGPTTTIGAERGGNPFLQGL